MNMRRKIIASAAVLVADKLVAPLARAQARGKIGRLLVGTPPGSQLDLIARIVADRLRVLTGQTFVVENRPGATGRIAMQQLRAAEPDGSVLMIVPSGWLTTLPHTSRNVPFDTMNDFAPVSKACSFSFAFAAGPATPARTLAEFVDWCRANPAMANFAVPIAGGTLELLGWVFGKSAKLDLPIVPYKGGGGEFRRDLIGGRVASGLALVSEFVPDHETGRVRILAVTGPTREKVLPGVPTFTELGYRDVLAKEWFGFIAPGRTPPEAVDRLAAGVRDAMQTAAVLETFAKLGLEPTVVAGRAFREDIRSEYDRWGRIVKLVGFTPTD